MASESWVVAGPQIIEIEAITSLRVQLAGGRVDVVAHDGPGARIEVHAVDGRPLEVSLSGDGELRVGYQFTLGGWDGFLEKFRNFSGKDRADVHLAVPREVHAKVGTVSADGLLAGIEQDASVSTVSGTLIADGTRSAFTFPWLFMFAGGLLVITTLAVSVFGDGLRDAMDPASKRSTGGHK